MMVDLNLQAEGLLPHKGAMCLLDKVIAADEETLVATTVFRSDGLFCRDGRVGAWVSLECMAQAVAAWAGYHGSLNGQPPRLGFLLGSSRFDCARPWISIDRTLRIEVQKQIETQEGLGQFTGRVLDGGDEIASAVITVFSPADPIAVLRGG